MDKALNELNEAQRILNEVIAQVSMSREPHSLSTEIWRAFSKIEYSVLLLKLRLKNENPGQLVKPPKLSEGLRDELVRAADLVSRALLDIRQESYGEALLHARQARDILREIQLVLRKTRAAS